MTIGSYSHGSLSKLEIAEVISSPMLSLRNRNVNSPFPVLFATPDWWADRQERVVGQRDSEGFLQLRPAIWLTPLPPSVSAQAALRLD
jgi:hypothetical protein